MSLHIFIIDYTLGIIMWTLIGRSAMNIFQREDSQFFFMRVFVKYTNPVLRMFRFITPRFYLMPYLLGYSVMGMLSFPLESEIAQEIYRLFGKN